jgi:hypothetical protein
MFFIAECVLTASLPSKVFTREKFENKNNERGRKEKKCGRKRSNDE